MRGRSDPTSPHRNFLLLLAGIALLFFADVSLALELNAYHTGSYEQILRSHTGRPFVLVYWSIDCPPCHGELKMLGQLRARRSFDLVLVSTDGPGAREDVKRVLREMQLDRAEAWLFAGHAQRLRFEVDRQWYGELPRSYLFDAEHRRRALSGRLQEPVLLQWLQAARP